MELHYRLQQADLELAERVARRLFKSRTKKPVAFGIFEGAVGVLVWASAAVAVVATIALSSSAHVNVAYLLLAGSGMLAFFAHILLEQVAGRSRRKLALQNRGPFPIACSLSVQNEGVRVCTRQNEVLFNWRAIRSVGTAADSVVLETATSTPLVIPADAFDAEETKRDFIRTIRSKLPAPEDAELSLRVPTNTRSWTLMLIGGVIVSGTCYYVLSRPTSECATGDFSGAATAADKAVVAAMGEAWLEHATLCIVGSYQVAVPANAGKQHEVRFKVFQDGKPVLDRDARGTQLYGQGKDADPAHPIVNIWRDPKTETIQRLWYQTVPDKDGRYVLAYDLNFDGQPDTRTVWKGYDIVESYVWYQSQWHKMDRKCMTIGTKCVPVRFERGEWRLQGSH